MSRNLKCRYIFGRLRYTIYLKSELKENWRENYYIKPSKTPYLPTEQVII